MFCRSRLGLTLGLTFWVGAVAWAGAASGQSLEFLDRFIWFTPHKSATGFSGLSVRQQGSRFVTVSDKGAVATGLLVRREGKIIGVADVDIGLINDRNGDPVRRYDVDAEGLTGDGSGGFFVSFEANHRVWHYPSFDGPATALPSAPEFRDFQNNSGMEALATDPQGRLLTLPERSGKWERPFPVFRFEDGAWTQPFSIPRRGTLLPVGADFGPDGWLYLLERDFVWYKGFASRIRRFQIGSDGVEQEETLLETPFGLHDNLEGLSVWQDAEGKIILTMISDDNGNILQRTEFVEYRLVEAEQREDGG